MADIFNGALTNIFNEMLALSNGLTGVARGIGGLGAMLYIGTRVWKQLANNEPIDFFPLFRPFVIAFFITIYPSFIKSLNAILHPLETGTSEMINYDLKERLSYVWNSVSDKIQEEPTVLSNPEHDKKLITLGVLSDGFNKAFTMLVNPLVGVKAGFNSVLLWLLEYLFKAAEFVINVIRTFYLIILAIIGPISFGIGVWDGFKDSIVHWLARYIQIFLWVPVANILGAICIKTGTLMENIYIELIIGNGGIGSFIGSELYMIFLLVGIIGYCTVPQIASYIVQSTGVSSIISKITNTANSAAQFAGAVVSGGTSVPVSAAAAVGTSIGKAVKAAGGTNITPKFK